MSWYTEWSYVSSEPLVSCQMCITYFSVQLMLMMAVWCVYAVQISVFLAADKRHVWRPACCTIPDDRLARQPSSPVYVLLPCLVVSGNWFLMLVFHFNRLTHELPQHRVPRLPDTTVFETVFFGKFPSRYFGFTGINQRPAGWYFGLTGICNGRRRRFFCLAGERVKTENRVVRILLMASVGLGAGKVPVVWLGCWKWKTYLPLLQTLWM